MKKCSNCNETLNFARYLNISFLGKDKCQNCNTVLRVNRKRRFVIALLIGIMIMFLKPLLSSIDLFPGSKMIFLVFYLSVMFYVAFSDKIEIVKN